MDCKKYYFATSNKQKLERIQKLFPKEQFGVHFELIPELIEVDEDAETAIGNALQKLEPYECKYDVPVLSMDTAIFYDDINFDPTRVKRQALDDAQLDESSLSQEQIFVVMRDYYIHLAKDHGGELDFYFLDGCAVLYPDGSTVTFSYKRENTLTDVSVGSDQLYFPLCNVYKSKHTGKHYMDRTKDEYFNELSIQVQAFKENIFNHNECQK